MHDIGHNKPPSQVEFTIQTTGALSDWLTVNPVIESEEAAREGKLLVDRARASLTDMELERKNRVAPLQRQVKVIDDEYRSARSVLAKILDELKDRLHVWVKAEEARRLKAAQEARQRAMAAEEAAREADRREREAREDAASGVETDFGNIARHADTAFNDFQRSQREVARAEAATNVKIGGGFKPALSLHALEKRELVVTDPAKLLSAVGWSERLIEALKSDARAYRIEYGKWPEGIIERKI